MQLGAQLYTLRNYIQNEKDFAFSMEKVAEMGYKTVQVSGIGKDLKPAVIKRICDDNGLSIVITHWDQDRILHDTEAVIEEHNIMDCQYIGIGMMAERYRSQLWLPHFIDDYKPAAEKIAAAGKLLMYHNHSVEFEKYDGKYVMDILTEGFGADELGITLDTYWVQASGCDVVQWIQKLKDRIPCVHLKDFAVVNHECVMAPVMEGNMNFPAILKALEDTVCKYMLVEQDVCQRSPFDCLKTSYDNVTQLGYK